MDSAEKKATNTAFTEAQNSNIYPDGIQKNFWHIGRNKTILHYLNRWRAEPLLEIGAGRGIPLEALLQHGWKAQGVDLTLTTPISPQLPIQYGVDVLSETFSHTSRYRSVALFDVIEHLPDRIDFLTRLRHRFENLRYLYVTVPSPPDLWSNYDEAAGHYLRYDPRTLKQELEASGYRVIFMRYFFHGLYWVIKLTLSARQKRAESFTPPKGLWILFHRAIGEYCYYEARILPGSWRGSSIIAVAEPIK
ncbi:MAG: class I SAM-dependent methyltransferase [Bacteroidia bacterium]|nr:class I SAM-dependent methyltransferase [Bacteroidia bacterium]